MSLLLYAFVLFSFAAFVVYFGSINGGGGLFNFILFTDLSDQPMVMLVAKKERDVLNRTADLVVN